jgi:hypothetical protein
MEHRRTQAGRRGLGRRGALPWPDPLSKELVVPPFTCWCLLVVILYLPIKGLIAAEAKDHGFGFVAVLD